jgi:hypothetical protein
MNTTTSRRRRFPARAAAIATFAVVIFGAAACGSEKASDVAPAAPAPAPAPQAQIKPHVPVSPDTAERQGNANGSDSHTITTPDGHEIYMP